MKSTSRLLYFYGEECEHCKNMDSLIGRLEKKLGVTLEKYEVWHNQENAKKMEQYDKNFCGGVPFFYNTKSNEWICGEVGFEKLKKWAES